MFERIYGKVKKHVITYAVLTVLITAVMGVLVPEVISRISWFAKETSVNSEGELYTYVLENDVPVTQTFTTPYRDLKGISLAFGRADNSIFGELEVTLKDARNGKTIGTWQRKLGLIESGVPEEFYLGKAYPVEAGHEFVFEISVRKENPDSMFSVYGMSDESRESEETPAVADGRIKFSVYGYDSNHASLWLFYLVTFLLTGLIAAMVYMRMSQKAGVMLDSVGYMDWLFVLAAFLLGCFIFNQAGDMYLTLHHAEDLISSIFHGQFFDFYDVILDKSMRGGYGTPGFLQSANYNIVLYLILAVLISPLVLFRKITGIAYSEKAALLYMNIFLAAAVILSAYLLFKLAREMGQKEKDAKLTAYLYLSSILTVFCTVGFSQLDIFYILIVLWALLLFVKHKYMKFSFVMSVAIMLKTFPLLIFVPLILFVEKRILHIIKYLAAGISSTLIFKLIFSIDPGYAATQEKLGKYYGFMGRLFGSGVVVGHGLVAFFIAVVIVLCIYAYEKRCTGEELWKYVVVTPLIVFGAFAVFVAWHPQWLAIMAPFMALAISVDRKRQIMVYLDWGIGVFLLLLAGLRWPGGVDNYMMNHGILSTLTGFLYNGVTMEQIIGNIDYLDVMIVTALVTMTGYFVIAAVRDILRKKGIGDDDDSAIYRWTVWARPASLYIYCFGLMCLYFFA